MAIIYRQAIVHQLKLEEKKQEEDLRQKKNIKLSEIEVRITHCQ